MACKILIRVTELSIGTHCELKTIKLNGWQTARDIDMDLDMVRQRQKKKELKCDLHNFNLRTQHNDQNKWNCRRNICIYSRVYFPLADHLFIGGDDMQLIEV